MEGVGAGGGGGHSNKETCKHLLRLLVLSTIIYCNIALNTALLAN